MTGKLELQARLFRRSVRRAAQQWRFRRFSLQGVPVLFANSFPKSGTHLLTQVLEGFTRLGPAVNSGLPAIVMYDGWSGAERLLSAILQDVRRLRPGDIAYGHVHGLPEITRQLSQPGFATYFILRDPRDVVVSHVHYVTELEPKHIHHRYYTEQLHSFDERLETSIRGLPDPDIPFPDIASRFAPFLPWLEDEQVLTLHYEALLNSSGEALGRVLDHAVRRGFPLHIDRQAAVQVLRSSIDPKRSPTFRRGKTGGWHQAFSPENKQVFKEVAGELLVQLGYERDLGW